MLYSGIIYFRHCSREMGVNPAEDGDYGQENNPAVITLVLHELNEETGERHTEARVDDFASEDPAAWTAWRRALETTRRMNGWSGRRTRMELERRIGGRARYVMGFPATRDPDDYEIILKEYDSYFELRRATGTNPREEQPPLISPNPWDTFHQSEQLELEAISEWQLRCKQLYAECTIDDDQGWKEHFVEAAIDQAQARRFLANMITVEPASPTSPRTGSSFSEPDGEDIAEVDFYDDLYTTPEESGSEGVVFDSSTSHSEGSTGPTSPNLADLDAESRPGGSNETTTEVEPLEYGERDASVPPSRADFPRESSGAGSESSRITDQEDSASIDGPEFSRQTGREDSQHSDPRTESRTESEAESESSTQTEWEDSESSHSSHSSYHEEPQGDNSGHGRDSHSEGPGTDPETSSDQGPPRDTDSQRGDAGAESVPTTQGGDMELQIEPSEGARQTTETNQEGDPTTATIPSGWVEQIVAAGATGRSTRTEDGVTASATLSVDGRTINVGLTFIMPTPPPRVHVEPFRSLDLNDWRRWRSNFEMNARFAGWDEWRTRLELERGIWQPLCFIVEAERQESSTSLMARYEAAMQRMWGPFLEARQEEDESLSRWHRRCRILHRSSGGREDYELVINRHFQQYSVDPDAAYQFLIDRRNEEMESEDGERDNGDREQ